MKWHIPLFGLAIGIVGSGGPAIASDPQPVRVLYVGNDRERASDYEACNLSVPILAEELDRIGRSDRGSP